MVVQPAQQHAITAGQLGLDPKDQIIHRLPPPSQVGKARPRGEIQDQAVPVDAAAQQIQAPAGVDPPLFLCGKVGVGEGAAHPAVGQRPETGA